MPIPSRPDFEAALRTHSGSATAEQLDALLPALLLAWDAVLPFRPLSTIPVAAPWSEPAVAFEATWADTHSVVVAVRQPEAHNTPAQIMLRRAGQLEYAFGTSHEQLAEALEQRLSRQRVKHPSGVEASAAEETSPQAE